ncbi:MAG: hypothetical protein ACRELA_17950 [Candidatus Rokuibacteriota bacterium]
MRHIAVAGALGLLVATGAVPVSADVRYEAVVRTTDSLTRGTVELEEKVTVSVKGDRLRQEVQGARTVVTRRGARYQKPGHRVTLDQLDRGLRYDINLDAGTYAEESLAGLRQQHEETITAAEQALKVNPAEALPALSVTVERTGEQREVHGTPCERVVLRSATEIVLTATRGGGPVGSAPTRFSMTFDVCLARDSALREVRAIEERVETATGERGALAERQLRIFAARRDVLAVYELMQRLMDRERQNLGGTPMRWEETFVGPRREQRDATLYRHFGEITRIEHRPLDASSFELPAGLTLDARRAGRLPAQ